ncbi:MAG: cell division protein FtsA, partial [Chloroflexi bacterium]|nr:cell division protein FtsA [Chloroflexota bacterium]
GVVVNIPEAQEAIQSSLQEALRSSGSSIRGAYVGAGGSHLEFSTRWGTVRSPHYSVPISYEEVDRCLEAANPAELPPEKQVLHLIARTYSVDGLKGVRNPIGMHALRLDVEALCVVGAAAPLRSLVQAVEHNHIRPASLVMAGLACGEAVLTRDETEMGAVLVDLGGGTTTIAVFQQGTLWTAAVLPVGGSHCTNDLAVALNTPFDVAEQVKVQHGHAIPTGMDDERVELEAFGDRHTVKIERREIARYLNERVEEILRLVQLKLRALGYPVMPPAGIVLTGGSANLPGLEQVARKVFSCPVRIGRPKGIQGLPDELKNPAYATVVGSLLWGVHRSARRANGYQRFAGTGNGLSIRPEVSANVVGWLKERVKRVAL